MTATQLTSLTGQATPGPLLTRRGWMWLAGIGVAFFFLHFEFFRRMWWIATTDNNWSHALVVPLISAYFIFQKREELARLPQSVCWWGLPILFAGMFSYIWWIYPGRNDMFRGYSMILTLFGLVLFLLGTRMMRVLWFPILYLSFGVKVSDGIWERIAWQLQQIAAKGSEVVLQFLAVVMDFDIARAGNQLTITFSKMVNGVPQTVSHDLNVAEACSGLRMLMAFIALGVAMAFLWDRAWWQRLTMVVMTVPIALMVNIGRVTAIAILYMFDAEKAQGEFHIFVGMLMLIPAAGLFLLLGWILDKIIIHPEIEERRAAGIANDYGQSFRPRGDAEEPSRLDRRAIIRAAAVGLGLVAVVGVFYVLLLVVGDAVPVLGRGVVGAALRIGLATLLVLGLLPVIRRGIGKFDLTRAGGRYRVMAFSLAVLVVSLGSQWAVLEYLNIVLIKKPVPLRFALSEISQEGIGTWKFVQSDPPMPKDIEAELGTQQYLSWWFVDTARQDLKQVDLRRGEFEPGSVARVHIAYYTGKPDTVPHVPDRCFVAAGLQPIYRGIIPLHLEKESYLPDEEHGGFLHPTQKRGMARVPMLEIPARIFTFGNPDAPGLEQNVLYFFAANGQYLATPSQVRAQGFNLTDEHSFYCKIEVQMLRMNDRQEAAERAADLLTHLLPEIMACLPDWVEVTEGRWPVDKNQSLAAGIEDGSR